MFLKKQQFQAPAVQPNVQICHAKNRYSFVIFMAFYCYFSFISYTFLRLYTEIGRLFRVRAAALKFCSDHWFTKRVILGDATLKSRERCHLFRRYFNSLNPELNPTYYLLSLLAHHFFHVSRIRVKSLTLRLLMSYIYEAPILDVSRSHTTTQHSR